MKVKRKAKEGFKPVVIELKLESQSEVDAVFSITRLNCSIPELVGDEGSFNYKIIKKLLNNLYNAIENEEN